jgi:hypothetical protein
VRNNVSLTANARFELSPVVFRWGSAIGETNHPIRHAYRKYALLGHVHVRSRQRLQPSIRFCGTALVSPLLVLMALRPRQYRRTDDPYADSADRLFLEPDVIDETKRSLF